MWLKSAEFAEKFGVNIRKIQRITKKANEKILRINTRFFVFSITAGIGRAGRVLMIWDKPFESEGEVAEFVAGGVVKEYLTTETMDCHEVVPTSRNDELPQNSITHPQTPSAREGALSLDNATSQGALMDAPQNATQTPKKAVDSSPCECKAQNDNLPAPQTPLRKGGGLSLVESPQKPQGALPLDNATSQGALKPQTLKDTHPQTPSAREGALMPQNEIPQNRVKFKMQSKISQQKQRNLSMQKMALLKDYEVAKKGKVSVKHFIESVNSRKNYSFEVTQNKLFAWQRAFKNSGLEGLCDTRGGRASSLLSNEHKDLIDELIKATRGRVNISSMHRLFHANLANLGKCDFEAFLAKEQEIVSYGVIERYVKAFFKANPFYKKLIEKGEDGAVSAFLPALGVANYNVTSINQIVEIDATSIDAIIDTSALAAQLGIEVENIEQWQKRFVLIALIDTFSGVCSFHISDTENSLGVSRAIAKYIMKYGKPVMIKSDNGSAFISKYIQEVLARLDIEHKRTPAYSGWCKPFVERNFGRLQNHLMEWIKGYIGHSVAQRQAIEFFFSRQQRRLKRGQKSNQKDLHTLSELGAMIDE